MPEITPEPKRRIAVVVHKYTLQDQPREMAFWRTQSYEARLAAVEEMRKEYHGWTDETRPRLARVYRVVKRK